MEPVREPHEEAGDIDAELPLQADEELPGTNEELRTDPDNDGNQDQDAQQDANLERDEEMKDDPNAMAPTNDADIKLTSDKLAQDAEEPLPSEIQAAFDSVSIELDEIADNLGSQVTGFAEARTSINAEFVQRCLNYLYGRISVPSTHSPSNVTGLSYSKTSPGHRGYPPQNMGLGNASQYTGETLPGSGWALSKGRSNPRVREEFEEPRDPRTYNEAENDNDPEDVNAAVLHPKFWERAVLEPSVPPKQFSNPRALPVSTSSFLFWQRTQRCPLYSSRYCNVP